MNFALLASGNVLGGDGMRFKSSSFDNIVTIDVSCGRAKKSKCYRTSPDSHWHNLPALFSGILVGQGYGEVRVL